MLTAALGLTVCFSLQGREKLFSITASALSTLLLEPPKAMQMLVQRERSLCWYKTRLHSLRPMCKHIGLTSTMWSIKMRSLSIRYGKEAVAEKQPQSKWSNVCWLLKNSKDSSKRCFSLAVDTVGQLEVGVVTVHSLSIACFTSHNRKTAAQYHASRT